MPDLRLPSQPRTSLPCDWHDGIILPRYIGTHVYEQLAQGRYLAVEQPGVERAISRVASQRPNHYTTTPHCGMREQEGLAVANIARDVVV